METVLEFLGFSVGASLVIGVARSLSGGLRPLLRGTMKAGLAAADAISSTAAGGSRGAASATPNGGPDSNEPRQIIIAHE
jgi:hypothetical protein